MNPGTNECFLCQRYEERYFRGKAKHISSQLKYKLKKDDQFHKHLVFLRSCLGPPYNAIDDAIEMTLKSLVSCVTVIDSAYSFDKKVIEAEPDLALMFNTPCSYTMEMMAQIDEVRKHNIPMAVWMPDDPYFIDINVPFCAHFDYVFTVDSSCVPFYQQQGCNAHYLALGAFTPHFHPLGKERSFQREVSFIGQCTPFRINFLNPILPQLLKFNVQFSGTYWRVNDCNLFDNHYLDTIQTNELYNETKIVLNIHQSMVDHEHQAITTNRLMNLVAQSPNLRTFEICAAGAFQLTDIRTDLTKFYIPGVEIETYTSKEELIEKVNYYLQHDEARGTIALKGLERTLKDHTYVQRLRTMLNIVFS